MPGTTPPKPPLGGAGFPSGNGAVVFGELRACGDRIDNNFTRLTRAIVSKKGDIARRIADIKARDERIATIGANNLAGLTYVKNAEARLFKFQLALCVLMRPSPRLSPHIRPYCFVQRAPGCGRRLRGRSPPRRAH